MREDSIKVILSQPNLSKNIVRGYLHNFFNTKTVNVHTTAFVMQKCLIFNSRRCVEGICLERRDIVLVQVYTRQHKLRTTKYKTLGTEFKGKTEKFDWVCITWWGFVKSDYWRNDGRKNHRGRARFKYMKQIMEDLNYKGYKKLKIKA